MRRFIPVLVGAAALAAAHLIDAWAVHALALPSANDRDWGRFLRILGFAPTWLVIAVAIMLTGTNEPTGEDMMLHLVAQGLSRYDLPEFFVVLGEFPLTASGKILKRVLVEWHRAGRFAAIPIERVALKDNLA